jgi:hypothetical protein
MRPWWSTSPRGLLPSAIVAPRLAALALLIAATGCSFRVGYDEPPSCNGPACAADARIGPDGSPVDTGADAAPAGGPGCGSLQLLRDDFANGSRDVRWSWPTGGAEVAEADGRVEIRLAAGTGEAWGTQESSFRYDFRDSELGVEVVRTGGRVTWMRVRDSVGRGPSLAVEAGHLQAITRDGGVETIRREVPYDAAAHRHWRLRHRNGEVLWDTSADGASWTALHGQAVTMDPTAVHAELGMSGRQATDSQAWFESVNATARAAPGPCAASTVGDDFDDGVVGGFWYAFRSEGDCTASEVDGHAALTFRGSAFAFCSFQGSELISLEDSALSFELVDAPAGGTTLDSFVALYTAARVDPTWSTSTRLELHVIDGEAIMKTVIDDATRFEQRTGYDPIAHRFWRFREAAGTTFWETSPDGAAWTIRASEPTRIDLGTAWLGLSGAQYAPGAATARTIRYDNVNRR